MTTRGPTSVLLATNTTGVRWPLPLTVSVRNSGTRFRAACCVFARRSPSTGVTATAVLSAASSATSRPVRWTTVPNALFWALPCFPTSRSTPTWRRCTTSSCAVNWTFMIPRRASCSIRTTSPTRTANPVF